VLPILPLIFDPINALNLGMGARWSAYPSDQATELGVVLLALGLVFIYLGVRTKDRIYRVHQKMGGLGGLMVFVTWMLSAAVVVYYFGLLSSSGALVPSPVSPVTFTTAGIAFVVILLSASWRDGANAKVAVLSAIAGAVVGVMVFELPFLFMIAPRLGLSLTRALWSESPLFCLVFASYSLSFLSPLAGFSRYTLFSIGAVFIVLSSWAFLTNFAFPSDPESFVLNSVSKVLGFVSAFTLFFHKND
jgi:hypothetical protein